MTDHPPSTDAVPHASSLDAPGTAGAGSGDIPSPEGARGEAERRAAIARAAVVALLARLRTRQRVTLVAAAVALSATLAGTAWALLSASGEPEVVLASSSAAMHREEAAPSPASGVAEAPNANPDDPAATPRSEAGDAVAPAERVADTAGTPSPRPEPAATASGASSLESQAPIVASVAAREATGGVTATAPARPATPPPASAASGATSAAAAAPRPAAASPFRSSPSGSDTQGPSGLCDIQPGPEAGRQMRRCIEAYSRLDRAGL